VRLLDIHNPFNAPVYHEETVGSTMDVSRFLAQNNAPHGTVIAADFQEVGRGRIRERRWEMEKGNSLAFTILLRFASNARIPVALTLRAGLAVALAIEDFVPALAGKALIKWPNDILLPSVHDGKSTALKVAGILAEAENGNVHIGIGVNLMGDRHLLCGKATSVCFAAGREYNHPGDRHFLLGKILSRLYDEIETADWRELIEARLFKKGEQICFAKGSADSGNMVNGILAGIGSDGELLVLPHDETETQSFATGELLFFR
jgi:BirA family biotin operon repressor/biotin-[acetyl-CoA-carboxylase] ligase